MIDFFFLKETFDFVCSLQGYVLDSITTVHDLGILLSCDLSWSDQHKKMLSMAIRTLSLIRRTFGSDTPILVKRKLYISFMKSLFKYCSLIWKPYLIKVKLLESIQMRPTKYILNNYTSNYKDCILELNIQPLAVQLKLNDVYFKAIKSLCLSIGINQYLITSKVNTRFGEPNYNTFIQLPLVVSILFFNHFPRTLNALPVIDSLLSMITIKKQAQAISF